MDSEITQLFLTYSVKKLQQMSGHIEACLAKLNDNQIWSRGAPHENSVGNLILHLCGNVRQWIGAGVGGQKDVRVRDKEFSAGGGYTASELLLRLHQTVDEAISIINGVSPERLRETINPQTGPVSVLDAIYQVVGHFQQHTGQIMFATKICVGEDLGFTRLPPAVSE